MRTRKQIELELKDANQYDAIDIIVEILLDMRTMIQEEVDRNESKQGVE